MSKKDKSKFRRRLRAEILKGMEQTQTKKPTSSPAPMLTQQPAAPSVPRPMSEPPAQPRTTPAPGAGLQVGATDTFQMVRHDLKKSAVIIGSIIILIVALYFIDQKTGILLRAGNEIFKVLHIGA